MPTYYINSTTHAVSTDNANFSVISGGAITYNANSVSIYPNRLGTWAGFVIYPATDTIVLDGVTKAAGFYTPASLVAALNTVFPNATTNGGGGSSLNLGPMSTTQRDAISAPVSGMKIFNTTTGIEEMYEDSVWQWMPFGWQQEGINRYAIDAARSFYTANSDTYFTTGTVNSGSFTNGVQTGWTAEAAPAVGMNTNALSNGRCFITSGNGVIVFGSGVTMLESRVLIPVLSNSTDRFVLFSGFNDSTTSNDITNGMGIMYDEGGNSTGSTASPNFQLVTAVNNVRTFNPTSIVVTVNTWYRLRVLIAADGSWVRYYINDVLVNPSGTDVTTNIPTTYVRPSRVNVFMSKVLGTTNRIAYVNTVRFKQKYLTARA